MSLFFFAPTPSQLTNFLFANLSIYKKHGKIVKYMKRKKRKNIVKFELTSLWFWNAKSLALELWIAVCIPTPTFVTLVKREAIAVASAIDTSARGILNERVRPNPKQPVAELRMQSKVGIFLNSQKAASFLFSFFSLSSSS